MYHTSFIIPFSTDRIANLEQMLRFLKEERIASSSELVLVCQDVCAPLHIPGFASVSYINLQTSQYCRAKACNLGVQASQSSIIVILDSDRILPPGYFSRVCESAKTNQCITTDDLWQLTRPTTDEEILVGHYDAIPDSRSTSNEMHKKGMFSGNTVMFREAYLNIGGMDESYVDYGYQDIDFAKTAMSYNMEMVFLKDKELHLYHTRTISQEEVRRATVRNGIKYCKKWKLPPEQLLIERGLSVGIDVIGETTMPKLRPQYITQEERKIIADWAAAVYAIRDNVVFLPCSPYRKRQTHLTIPPIVYDIQKKIIADFELEPFADTADLFLNQQLTDTFVNRHVHEPHLRGQDLRFNIMITASQSGGVPICDGETIDAKECDLWIFNGNRDHETTVVVGGPRHIISYGFIVNNECLARIMGNPTTKITFL